MSTDGNRDGIGKQLQDKALGRRKYMAAAGGALTAGLAGCTSSNDDQEAPDPIVGNGGTTPDDEDEDDSSSGDSGAGGPPLARIAGGTLPADMDWSPWAQQGFGRLADWMCDEPAKLHANGELVLWALDDWYYDEDRQAIGEVLRDDLVFWNGDSYTAEDRYVYQEMLRLMSPEGSSFEEVIQVDDYTTELILKEPANPQILRGTHVVHQHVQRRKDIWQPWLEQLQDASNQEARDEIVANQLQDFRIPIDEVIEKGLGTGSYKLVDYDERTLHFEVNEHHRYADDLEIREYKEYVAEGAAAEQMIINDDVHFATSLMSEELKGRAPDHLEPIAEWTSMFMYKVLINQRNHEDLRDRNVRRAMACAMNFENIQLNWGQGGVMQYQSGLDRSSTEGWLDGRHEDYHDYGVVTNEDLADHFLELSGYSREDGTIYRPDGEEMEPIRYVNQNRFHTIPNETAAYQLEEFGFPIEYNVIPRQQALEMAQEQMGEWDMLPESHYASGTQHPFSFFNYASMWGYRLGPAGFGPHEGLDQTIENWLDEGLERSPYNGKLFRPEIPTEVGAEDLSGSTERIDVYQIINDIESGRATPEETREYIQKLSWMWNFDVPDIDLTYFTSGHWANTRDFDWPVGDFRLETNNGPYPLIKSGEVTYK